MRHLDLRRARQVHDGARQLQDPVVGAGGEAQLLDGFPSSSFTATSTWQYLPGTPWAHAPPASRRSHTASPLLAEPLLLDRSCLHYPLADNRRRLNLGPAEHLLLLETGHSSAPWTDGCRCGPALARRCAAGSAGSGMAGRCRRACCRLNSCGGTRVVVNYGRGRAIDWQHLATIVPSRECPIQPRIPMCRWLFLEAISHFHAGFALASVLDRVYQDLLD
jgi:hypothetical protein